MTLIRTPFDGEPKFAIRSELKISDIKRKTNNIKYRNGISTPKKRSVAENSSPNISIDLSVISR